MLIFVVVSLFFDICLEDFTFPRLLAFYKYTNVTSVSKQSLSRIQQVCESVSERKSVLAGRLNYVNQDLFKAGDCGHLGYPQSSVRQVDLKCVMYTSIFCKEKGPVWIL